MWWFGFTLFIKDYTPIGKYTWGEETDETIEEANADTAEDAVTTEETVEEAAEAEEAAQTDAEEQTEAEGEKEE